MLDLTVNYEKMDVSFHIKIVSLVNQTYLNTSLKYVFGTTLGSGARDTACNVLVCAETCVILCFNNAIKVIMQVIATLRLYLLIPE